MDKRIKNFVMSGVVGAIGFYAAGAHAAPLPAFTFDPVVAGLGAFSAFTADNIILHDDATIIIHPNGTFTETGTFQVAGFFFKGVAVTPAGFHAAGGYGMGGTFTSSGSGMFVTPTNFIAHLGSLSFNLIGDKGNDDVFSAGGITDPTSNDVTLGSGTLDGGAGTSASADISVPTAQLTATDFFQAIAGFTSPSPFYSKVQLSFTSTANETTCTVLVNGDIECDINDGGGTGNFIVPEPGTLAVFGVGLLGSAMFRYRRRRKA